MAYQKPSIGIFLARPERSFYMVRKLRERGFQVVHYNAVGYKNDPYARVREGFVPALAHLMLRTNHDVYFTSLSFVPSSCLYLNRRLRGKRYVFNATGVKKETFGDRATGKPFANLLRRRVYPFLLDCTFAGASRIVCNSHFLERTLGAEFPQYRDRLLTIYNGIEFERYSSGRRQRLRGEFGSDILFLCATTLNFENKSRGLQLVIDSFGQVQAERKEAKLIIAAKTSNPRYQGWVESYLKSKPWASSVSLLYNHNDMPGLLAGSDIFLYATPNDSNDSLPRALLEAQAAGLPVITTDTSGCPEIVRHGITGFVVPYDAGMMAERIFQLVDNVELRKEMGREAQQWILQTFNWDQMADRYAEVFLEVAGQSNGSVH